MWVSSPIDLMLQRREQGARGQSASGEGTEHTEHRVGFSSYSLNRLRVFTTREENLCCKLAKAHHEACKDRTDAGASTSKLQAVQKAKQNLVTALERHSECELIS